MAVPSIGVAWIAELRVAIAALAMLGYVVLAGVRLDVCRHWRAFLMMGLLNAAEINRHQLVPDLRPLTPARACRRACAKRKAFPTAPTAS